MKTEEIIAFARSQLEALPNNNGSISYPCAAYLNDGLYLPCVLIESTEERVKLAVRRFQETQADRKKPLPLRRWGGGMQYEDIVRVFVTSGNSVNDYDIARLEQSSFALPLHILQQIHGETSMAWTQFTGIMRDGAEFSFGTSYNMEFFQMPEGYTARDLEKVISHKRLPGEVLRERPFFTCYVEGL